MRHSWLFALSLSCAFTGTLSTRIHVHLRLNEIARVGSTPQERAGSESAGASATLPLASAPEPAALALASVLPQAVEGAPAAPEGDMSAASRDNVMQQLLHLVRLYNCNLLDAEEFRAAKHRLLNIADSVAA